MRNKGRVRVRLTGLGAERALNVLWKKGVQMYHVRRSRMRGVEMEVAQGAQKTVEEVAREKGFRLAVLNQGWGRKLKEGLKKRWGLALGVVLGLCLSAQAMLYIWQVEVGDAGKYAGEVRLFLMEEGLRPGIRKDKVDLKKVQEALQWRLPKVKWVWVKKEGSKLSIRLEEGISPQETGNETGDVVAARDGVLQRLTVFAGTPVCKEGEAVEKGQVLIRGEEKGENGEMVPVRAEGEAIAKIWEQKAIRMPLNELTTKPTGREAERLVFLTPFGNFTFEQEPDYLLYDRLYTISALPGAWLPFSVAEERFMELSGEWQQRNLEEVMQEAQKAAEEALIRACPEAQNIDKSVKFSMIDRGIIEVTATAVMETDIARFGNTP